MRFYGTRVYDLEESIISSGFPMLKKKYSPEEFELEVNNLKRSMLSNRDFIKDCKLDKIELDKLANTCTKDYIKSIKHFKRACNLGSATPNSGHDCFQKGILVSVNIEADQSFWLQWERYHHQDTISSMSTMHCLVKFEDLEGMFSKYTDKRILNVLKEYIEEYNNNPTSENFHKVIHNCPEGIELCRRVTLNYLQIKTMINQRRHHKMDSWKSDFINFTNSLPYFKELTYGLNYNLK